MSEFDHSTTVGRFLLLLQEGDDSVRAPLLAHIEDRVRRLARRLFRPERGLHGVDDTDDVVQQAMLRLDRALATVRPASVRDLFGLAALQIRRVIRDIARRVRRRQAHLPTVGVDALSRGQRGEPIDWEHDPAKADLMAEFHEAYEGLPSDLRVMVDLRWYNGLNRKDTAAVLGVSVATVDRRWIDARVYLQRELFPGGRDGTGTP